MTTILLGKECSTFLETDDSVLQRAEVRLVWAETVDTFVPLAMEHRPDLIVLDPQVAGFDAFACAREILSAVGKSVAVILIGNTADARSRRGGGDRWGSSQRPVTRGAPGRDGAPLPPRGRAREHARRGRDQVDFVCNGVEGLAYTRDLSTDGCFLHARAVGAWGGALAVVSAPGRRRPRGEGRGRSRPHASPRAPTGPARRGSPCASRRSAPRTAARSGVSSGPNAGESHERPPARSRRRRPGGHPRDGAARPDRRRLRGGRRRARDARR